MQDWEFGMNSLYWMQMDIVHPDINQYLLNLTPRRDPVIAAMEQYAAKRKFPIVGPLVGRVLFTLARGTRARRIFELGSGFGYSAFWFLKGMGPSGRVTCTDGDPANAERAKAYFRKAGLEKRVTFITGNALDAISTARGQFDIIFNDIDKEQYPEAFRQAVPKLKRGGLLITDNVLWSGKVLGRQPDDETAGILEYNTLIYSSKKLFTTILPIRDGVSVTMKL